MALESIMRNSHEDLHSSDLSPLPRTKLYYYEVALPLALKKNLIYSSHRVLDKGVCVFVELKNKKTPAVILNKVAAPQKKTFQIKSILSIDEERKQILPSRLKWLFWLSEYYKYNTGPVIHLSFPPKIKSKRQKASDIINENKISEKKNDILKPVLTEEQRKCLEEIKLQKNKGFQVHLLHGVTGSGKTEIYFRLIEPALNRGESVLVLVPEIALTPQHIERFSLRFPKQVACFHSSLSPKEKYHQWVSAVKGERKILIGPRSALFCPIPRLSWIIVDEEHESHFKQEEKLKYHGRDAAVYLGKCLDIPVILASATPSLESWWNAQTGKYVYHSLKKRVFDTSVPQIEVVDMKQEQNKSKHLPFWLSTPLYKALKDSLNNREQSALFLNRRGESSYIFCPRCAYSFSCVNCDISLTQHQGSHLLCHYCGFRREKPICCPECKGEELYPFGVGTALVQKELQSLFPTASIVRADRDEVKNHKQWADILNQIEKKEVDILIGTQMIAKGLDFPHLTLVGLILADQGLNHPDFRSGEKSFQLITQMAGRSGRRKTTGRVLLQSYNPSHLVIEAVTKGSYEHFVKQELNQRKKYGYPPFGKLVLIRVQSVSSSRAFSMISKIKDRLRTLKDLKVLGPAPAPYFRLRNKYRYHLLLKSVHSKGLKQAYKLVFSELDLSKVPAVQVYINPDPINMF